MSDVPVTRNPVVDRAGKVLDWLGRLVEKGIGPTSSRPPVPADLTDEQLHRAIYNIGADLLNGLGPVIQGAFARYGYDLNEHRFQHPITTTVRGHVLIMSTDATDAYGLAVIGLGKHATAAALGPIRFVLESLAWLSWLLEDPDEKVRRARAYRLTMNAIDGFQTVGETFSRVTSGSEHASEMNSRLGASSDRMRRELLALADEDGVAIPANPGSVSRLAEQYLSDHGGYLTYAMLNRAGAHPGPVHAFMFYGDPETGVANFDFQRMFGRRAYWLAVAIRLHLDLCDLAAPVLGWSTWEAAAAEARQELEPLADEAQTRYVEPVRRALARMPDAHDSV